MPLLPRASLLNENAPPPEPFDELEGTPRRAEDPGGGALCLAEEAGLDSAGPPGRPQAGLPNPIGAPGARGGSWRGAIDLVQGPPARFPSSPRYAELGGAAHPEARGAEGKLEAYFAVQKK